MSKQIDQTILSNTINSNRRQIEQLTLQLEKINVNREKYVALEASVEEIIGKLETTNKYNDEGKKFLKAGFSGVRIYPITKSINMTTENIEAIIAELRQILEITILERKELDVKAERIQLQINSLQRTTNAMKSGVNNSRSSNRTIKFIKIREDGKNCRYH